jgi:sortase B
MHALNNDMVGWIEIPGTSIDYPVMQSPYQTDFYLKRNFYKQNATCGAIYVREKCDVWEPSDNVTIYGHNMLNGTMFADLHDYEEKSFWKNNKLVYFDTLYEYHTYEIFAVFIVSGYLDKGFNYHTFDDAANAAEFDEFVATCKELALYDTGITPKYGEKLITLSTCDKSIENGRLVVVARRIM